MSELVEIIVNAIDQASQTFESITGSAQEMESSIEQSTSDGSSGFDELGSTAEAASESVQNVSDSCQSVDGTPMQDTADSTTQVTDNAEEAGGALDTVSGILAGIAGVEAFEGIADSLMEMADAAGSFNDSVMRAGLEAEGAGISMESMKDTVSSLSEETGRAGGQIRESFIKATARGVTDLDSFKTMMQGAGAQATLFGTDIETMGNKFSRMAQRGTLMDKQLAETGITMNELATAMGMTGATADEVREKWKELDVNQRAAILGTAASMNEGKDANDAYKNSWAGLNEKLNVAWDRLFRLAGEVLLPVLVPAIDVASRVLSALGDAMEGVMSGPMGGLVSVIGSLAAGFALAVPAILAIKGALAVFSAVIWPAVTASWALISPWIPFIAIGAAVAFVIYEIGKAFHWWDDVDSMIDAIWDGIQRMWNAFINHPDVQAALKAISDALAWIWNGLQQAGQAVLEFFGVNNSGDYDLVRGLILGIGAAWDVISLPIKSVIAAIQILAGAFSSFYSGTLVPFGDFLQGIFGPVWEWIMGVIQQITPFVTQLSDAFTAFQEGQLDLPGIIWAVLNFIGNAYLTVFTNILTGLGNFAMGILSGALTAGSNLVTGVVTWISQLPGRVWNYLVNTLTRIIAAGVQWVTAARTKANQLVNGVVSFLRSLPGKVFSALVAVVSRIVSAGAQWVHAAKQKATELVNGAYNALASLPGKVASALGGVKDAIVKPFQDAYNTVKGVWDKISSMASSLGGIASGGDMAAGGETAILGGNNTGAYTIEADNSPIVIEDNINLTLDLQNVPSNISSDGLIEALSDKNVLSAIANNRDFQDLDARVKQRISLKYGRSRGL